MYFLIFDTQITHILYHILLIGLTQKYMRQHKSEISVLTVNKSQTLCATADISPSPTNMSSNIFIWSLATAASCMVKQSIVTQKFSSIRSLDFSSDDQLLIVLASDIDGRLYILNIITLLLLILIYLCMYFFFI